MFPDLCDGDLEGPVVFAHEVGNDEGGRLSGRGRTLEMPAKQWTRTLVLESSASMRS